jgi:anti-anti-sigma factor
VSFQVVAEPDGDVQVLTVHGELDLSTAPELREPLERAIEGDQRSILIDLTNCGFIDSTGVALIVEAWHRLEREQGHLALCCPSSQVRRVLEITGIDSSISLHSERGDALAELRG